ncbi:hypothetical protein M231_05577 [Tremella mesenterica]|uniref:COP9 signalosome complex subunit 6 n=1 Tax=Tremella mesenterica TaxID=5217 RepID=A0A4Q1BHN3_TREME|nr:uncharacterized protein TREMEDRAFT_45417 [Tremella mesenterica DSM 1558]EIW66891.1 hypothetical protein TREMEDRAFT_45417 [Tremella mesenterica DSM 1558]RXK37126.1 hypothetical protein M231_05577 [Tremella mesenterica]
MASSSTFKAPNGNNQASHVMNGGMNSGLTVNLHPLPILNISEHWNRARSSSDPRPKVLGALLGTQTGREVSVTNSFELVHLASPVSAGGPTDLTFLDQEFLSTRKEQFKQVFPTLDLVGWYTIGQEPSAHDMHVHKQLADTIETCVFLLFHPEIPPSSQSLPIKVYESAFTEDGRTEGGLVPLDYGVETGEAERIAVDGVARGTTDESLVVGNLITQRNAVKMLYDRIRVLVQYVSATVDKTIPVDHTILRQISAVLSSLPVMSTPEFTSELKTEHEDVQLTSYLTDVIRQLDALNEYAEKHHQVTRSTGEGLEGHGRTRGPMNDWAGRRW